MTQEKPVELEVLRQLQSARRPEAGEPARARPQDVAVRHLDPGRVLFKEGDIGQAHASGSAGGDSELWWPIAPPPCCAADAATHARRCPGPAARSRRVPVGYGRIVAIDSDLLDVMITWDQTGS